jgi:proteasome accessory factor C
VAEAHLSPIQLADLEARADALLDQLRQVIRGRDAFLPAYARDDSPLVAAIKPALAQGETVHIAYQSLVDRQPYWREVFPLRLEQHGNLYYLHAYCHLAEANRTFRLDRIHDYRPAATQPSSGHHP